MRFWGHTERPQPSEQNRALHGPIFKSNLSLLNIIYSCGMVVLRWPLSNRFVSINRLFSPGKFKTMDFYIGSLLPSFSIVGDCALLLFDPIKSYVKSFYNRVVKTLSYCNLTRPSFTFDCFNLSSKIFHFWGRSYISIVLTASIVRNFSITTVLQWKWNFYCHCLFYEHMIFPPYRCHISDYLWIDLSRNHILAHPTMTYHNRHSPNRSIFKQAVPE